MTPGPATFFETLLVRVAAALPGANSQLVKAPPGFESSPRPGRALPKCHVGPGSGREEPAPGATPGCAR